MRCIRLYLEVVGFGGLLRAILAKLGGTSVFFSLNRNDCRHPVCLRLPSSDVPTYKQVFIDQDYDFSVTQQPEVIVDAGANIGLASIYFANKYPDAKIIALEPEQNNFQLLKDNTAPYANIIPVQAALWNANEAINLVDPGLGHWGYITETEACSATASASFCHRVDAFTIDRIMQDYGLAKIDILKIDIEGAEKEVFDDTSCWIDKVDAIIIELHERLKVGCNRSFYCGSNGFAQEWQQGENVYLSRGNCLIRRAA